MQLFFNQISFQLLFPLLILLTFLILVLWLFFNHGIDKLKHPEEWQDAGTAGERILYTTLVKQFKIPENQIFRNVYIPILSTITRGNWKIKKPRERRLRARH